MCERRRRKKPQITGSEFAKFGAEGSISGMTKRALDTALGRAQQPQHRMRGSASLLVARWNRRDVVLEPFARFNCRNAGKGIDDPARPSFFYLWFFPVAIAEKSRSGRDGKLLVVCREDRQRREEQCCVRPSNKTGAEGAMGAEARSRDAVVQRRVVVRGGFHSAKGPVCRERVSKNLECKVDR